MVCWSKIDIKYILNISDIVHRLERNVSETEIFASSYEVTGDTKSAESLERTNDSVN
jgi:hypothetical protein